MKALVAIVLWAVPLVAQSNTGELRLQVTDPAGLGVKSSVQLVSEANHYRESFDTEAAGILVVKRLPFGFYTLTIRQASFATVSRPIEIRSAVPANQLVKLGLVPLETTVEVKAIDTLIDPHRVGAVNYVGSETIA